LGGLESLQLSKDFSFLVVLADKAGKYHQKNREFGEALPPQTPPFHRVSPVKYQDIQHEKAYRQLAQFAD
jgi:hypothetical protein